MELVPKTWKKLTVLQNDTPSWPGTKRRKDEQAQGAVCVDGPRGEKMPRASIADGYRTRRIGTLGLNDH